MTHPHANRTFVEAPVAGHRDFEKWCNERGFTYHLNQLTYEFDRKDPASGLFYRPRPFTEDEFRAEVERLAA